MAKKKLNLFFADLRSELAKVDVKITEAELKQYKDALAQIELYSEHLGDFDAELRSFRFI
jgi:hypothetical protein